VVGPKLDLLSSFRLSFVIVIIRSNKRNGQHERKTYVLLACEMSGNYYKIQTRFEGDCN